MGTLYYPHEAKRHTVSIKQTVQRACQTVFTEANICFRLKGHAWPPWAAAEHLTVVVFQKHNFFYHAPICTIKVDRPRVERGRYEYREADAVLVDKTHHAGSTRLLGHLQNHCTFLPRIAVTMKYDLQEQLTKEAS